MMLHMGRLSVLLAAILLAAGCSPSRDAITIGAVYPTGGAQGSGGLEELRGVELAAELASLRGGVDGRPIELRLSPADSSDAAPFAVERLVDEGIDLIVGSYGSTVSRPAAVAATRRGALFWETGAVGEMSPDAAQGELVFRFAPTGGTLGRAAVRFVDGRLREVVHAPPDLRYTVAYVDDVYGRSVAEGAVEEIREAGLRLAGRLPYDLRTVDFDEMASRIGELDTDVLVAVAYLEDGVALQRALVRGAVPLVATIGSSSSHCMPEFGAILGPDAVGVFASDKPDADHVRPDRLTPEAAELLGWAREEYGRRFGEPMSAAALSGFAAGWALFHHVLPAADGLDPRSVATAARAVRLAEGALPNAAGLHLAPPGHPDAGANLRPATVIWQWVEENTRAVVWPRALAEAGIVPPDRA